MVKQIIKRARALYPGMVTLQSDLLPTGEARREDEARWTEQEAPEDDAEIRGGQGWDMVAGGAVGDRLLPEHDPDAPWNEGKSTNPVDLAKLPYDFGALDNADLTYPSPGPKMASVDAMQRNRESKNVTYSRLWPVPGDGRPAKKGDIGPNGKKYSDGRFAPAGGYRGFKDGKPRAHHGVDLPAPSGANVVAAESGTVRQSVEDPTGFGKNVVLGHDDGTVGLYAHLGPGDTPRPGTKVKMGQVIGKVGTSGSARTKGDHLHYEMRLDLGDRTFRKPSLPKGGVPIDPSPWIVRRVSSRSPMDD